ncbi:MAG: hypothetical protein ACJ780_08200 [Solirubrobacteraceae bacterium]
MNSWTITNLDLKPHSPEILPSTDEARAIAVMIPARASFDDHQVHQSAWVTEIDGEVEITTSGGESVTGSTGLVGRLPPTNVTQCTPAPTPASSRCSRHGLGSTVHAR